MEHIQALSLWLDKPIVREHRGVDFSGNEISIDYIVWGNKDVYKIQVYEYDIAIQGNHRAWMEEHFFRETSVSSNYYLKIAIDDKIVVDWYVDSHNQAFGCSCIEMQWMNDKLFFIYREKHYIYGCCFDSNGLMKRVCLWHELAILQDKVAYKVWSHPNEVKLLSLPELEELGVISQSEAEAQGILTDQDGSQNWYWDRQFK